MAENSGWSDHVDSRRNRMGTVCRDDAPLFPQLGSITRPSIPLPLMTQHTVRCGDCDTEAIQDCKRCGAPVCCPKCCGETTAAILKASPPVQTPQPPSTPGEVEGLLQDMKIALEPPIIPLYELSAQEMRLLLAHIRQQDQEIKRLREAFETAKDVAENVLSCPMAQCHCGGCGDLVKSLANISPQ